MRLFSVLLNKNTPFKLFSNHIEIPSIKDGRFHYSWLRDNCACSSCLHPSTRQKLHSSGSINSLVRPKKVDIGSSSLKIKWEDDLHESHYDLKWLERFNYNIPFTPLISPIQWNAKEYSNYRDTVDYSEFLSYGGYHRVLKQIRDYGISFLKNVPTDDPTVVEEVAKKFGVIKV